ncbi:MAG: aminoacyl-tRNA hydrolase [Candidatus Omnitrophica bacterium]|nr:aminoacyl-tRNA hydrolase [Candidatus Omnitrophota bacterium]
MRYIVGLGNPGLEYALTKHNIGFTVVKAIAKEAHIKINKKLRWSLFGRGRISGEDVALVLPQTYMNLSGKAVGELFTKGLIRSIDGLVIICDDINLGLGRIRLRVKGSSGGHKGLESIIHMLGRDDFARLRIGIATESHKGDITNYVLSPFKRKEMRNVSHVVALAKDACYYLISKGVEEAMGKFNRRKVGTS